MPLECSRSLLPPGSSYGPGRGCATSAVAPGRFAEVVDVVPEAYGFHQTAVVLRK